MPRSKLLCVAFSSFVGGNHWIATMNRSLVPGYWLFLRNWPKPWPVGIFIKWLRIILPFITYVCTYPYTGLLLEVPHASCLTVILQHILTSDSECEVPTSFLSSCSCHLTGVCPSITCGSCVDSQDVFIVDLPTIVPFYFTWSIWTGPGVAEWWSIR